jgi:hypothetical protein
VALGAGLVVDAEPVPLPVHAESGARAVVDHRIETALAVHVLVAAGELEHIAARAAPAAVLRPAERPMH